MGLPDTAHTSRSCPDRGSEPPTLRDRLPADLRDAHSGPDYAKLPFTSRYLLDDEWARDGLRETLPSAFSTDFTR